MFLASDLKTNGSKWLAVLRPLFVLLRKVTQIDVEETGYKMTLMLNLIKLLLTSVPDKDLQALDQSQVIFNCNIKDDTNWILWKRQNSQ